MNFSYDVLAQIASGTNMFSETENKLAGFILSNPEKTLSLSISELAESSHVSLATVTRFCKRLSLNGYQEFKLELMKSVSNKQESTLPENGFSEKDSIPDIISRVNTLHQNALNKSMTTLNPESVRNACDLIDDSYSVYFFGCGTMQLMAFNARLQFMQVSTKFHSEPDAASQALAVSLMNEKSVLVLFSYTGSTREIVELSKMAKATGAKVIAVTRYLQSPLVEHSDVVLICGVNEGPFQAGSSGVKLGMLYITDVLYMEYCRRHAAQTQENKEKTSTAVIGKLNPLQNKRKPRIT